MARHQGRTSLLTALGVAVSAAPTTAARYEPSAVRPMAVHSRDPFLTMGFSLGSKDGQVSIPVADRASSSLFS